MCFKIKDLDLKFVFVFFFVCDVEFFWVLVFFYGEYEVRWYMYSIRYIIDIYWIGIIIFILRGYLKEMFSKFMVVIILGKRVNIINVKMVLSFGLLG